MPQNRIPNEVALKRSNVGTQVFRDVKVPPTYKWYGDLAITESRPLADTEEFAGTFFGDYEITYGPCEISGTYNQDLYYEDLAILPRYGVKGGVTGVSDGNTIPGYLYTYVKTPSRDDFDVATVEHMVPGLPFEAEMLLFDQFTISADADDATASWKWASNIWARKNALKSVFSGVATGGSTSTIVQTGAGWTIDQHAGAYAIIRSGAAAGNAIEILSNTADTLSFISPISVAVVATNQFEISGVFTPGVADRSREKIAGPGTKVFLDPYAGVIGTTEYKKWISWSLTFMNQLSGKRFGSDIDSYSDKLGIGKVRVNGQIRLEFDDWIQYQAYKNKTVQHLRIEQLGSQINASPVTNKRARIDLPRIALGSPTLDPRATNITATFPLRGYVDIGLGYPYLISSFVPMVALP